MPIKSSEESISSLKIPGEGGSHRLAHGGARGIFSAARSLFVFALTRPSGGRYFWL
jgi:hypothetical protein